MRPLSPASATSIFLDQFFTVRNGLARLDPSGRTSKVLIHWCDEIESHRKTCTRSYMHVGHYRGYICCAIKAVTLPEGFRLGIFAHEMGHILTPGGTESDADRVIFEMAGIPIEYRSHPRYGKDLEWADPDIVRKKLQG